MRRTITTLMILAVSGLAFAARAADNGGNAQWGYYAAASSYRISDDDDTTSGVAHAGGQAAQAGQEQNALYVASGLSGEVAQTSYFDNGGCSCNSGGCGQCGCLSNCCRCD